MPNPFKSPGTLLKVSSWTSIASWASLALLLVLNYLALPLATFITAFMSLVLVGMSLVTEELGLRGYGEGRGGWGMAVIVAVAIIACVAIASFAAGHGDTFAIAVLCMFILSFVPTALDAIGVGRKHVYNEHRRSPDYEYSSDPLSLFGLGTPKTPPPIVIEQGDDLDEEWKKYLGVEIACSELNTDEVEATVESAAKESPSESDSVSDQDQVQNQNPLLNDVPEDGSGDDDIDAVEIEAESANDEDND